MMLLNVINFYNHLLIGLTRQLLAYVHSTQILETFSIEDILSVVLERPCLSSLCKLIKTGRLLRERWEQIVAMDPDLFSQYIDFDIEC